MLFRFEIVEAFPVRRPVVCLAGWLHEGDVKMFDMIAVPYTDGTSAVGQVVSIDVLHKRADYAKSEELTEQIGLCVSGMDVTRVQVGGVATGISRRLSSDNEPAPVKHNCLGWLRSKVFRRL